MSDEPTKHQQSEAEIKLLIRDEVDKRLDNPPASLVKKILDDPSIKLDIHTEAESRFDNPPKSFVDMMETEVEKRVNHKVKQYWMVIGIISFFIVAIGYTSFKDVKQHVENYITAKLGESGVSQYISEITNATVQITQLKTEQTNTILLVESLSSQLAVHQDRLETAQTNIEAQQTKLSDVEYWVQNLYNNMTDEKYSTTDTNHVHHYHGNNGGDWVFVMLNHAPIKGSAEVYMQGNPIYPEIRVIGTSFHRNLTGFKVFNYNMDTTMLSFHYVADNRETNLYTKFPNLDNRELVIQEVNNGFGAWLVVDPDKIK